MKVATIITEDATVAALLDGDSAVELPGIADVGALLAGPGLASAGDLAKGPRHALDAVRFGPLVPQPGKIVCVGLNYRAHILEMGRELPEHPTLFAKFAECLVSDGEDVVMPPESTQIDWEGELVVVIGSSVRRARGQEADDAIAGYTLGNDISMRDWQFRTREWLQGKAWANSTPVGPLLATAEELPTEAFLTTRIDGVEQQRGDVHDLVFTPRELVEYVSTMIPLHPGDLLFTGTPGGVGHARNPQVRLAPGQTVTVAVDGIGELSNTLVLEQTA